MHEGYLVVFWGETGEDDSPVRKLYLSEAEQRSERTKVDRVLGLIGFFGFRAPGLRVEKVQGAAVAVYELKISAFGVEHRFLAGFAPWRHVDGRPVLILVGYAKKKRRRLDRGDIETAVRRLRSCRGKET